MSLARDAVIRILIATVCIGSAACSGDRGSGGGDSVGGGKGQEVHAVQIGAFIDSSLAQRLSDSLSMSGWQSYVARRTGDNPFRVRVSPSRSADLAARVAFALRASGMDALAVVDTAPVTPLVEALPVNHGVHGMSARVRWLVSPNGRSLLVVHDPASVEADALPNAFIYASERDGYVLQRDSVWDVAPNPLWTRLAFGKAYTIAAAPDGVDSASSDAWTTVAAASGMSEDSVRAGAYLISGMSELHGFSRPAVVYLDAVDSATGKAAPGEEPLYVSGGWRVRWMRDSSLLAVGDAPIKVQDDSPPRNWLVVSLDSGSVQGTVSQSRLVPLDWRLGPALDVSIPIDTKSERTMRLEGASIISAAGWIRRDGKVVGPGVALAATRDGRFIAALAPRPDAKDYESPLEPVVYRVDR
jgi:hypothetical protein